MVFKGKTIQRRRAASIGRAAQMTPPTMPIEQLEPRTLLAGSVVPTATVAVANVSLWGPTHTFNVSYLSNKRIRTSQLDSNDITITGPNGYSRKARLISYVDKVKQVIARYKVSTPNVVWNAADNGTYTVAMNTRQMSDGGNAYVPGGTIGNFTVGVRNYPSDIGTRPGAQLGAISVTEPRFGAKPNDGQDDTAAIQAAIDSLPRANGVADTQVNIGGVVFLPAGTYNISGPLNISSGIALRGQGAGLTSIVSSSNDANSGAIKLVSYFGHGFMMQMGVEDMTITTAASKGIFATQTTGDIVGLTLSGLNISSGGAAIDLRQEDVYQTTIKDVTVKDPGSTAIWLTVARGNSASNRIQDVLVTGRARAGFKVERGMVVVGGSAVIDGLEIDETGAVVTPLFVVGGSPTISRVSLLSLPSSVPAGTLISINQSYAVRSGGRHQRGPQAVAQRFAREHWHAERW